MRIALQSVPSGIVGTPTGDLQAPNSRSTPHCPSLAEDRSGSWSPGFGSIGRGYVPQIERSPKAVTSSVISRFVHKKFASRGFLVVLCSAFALVLPFVLSQTHGGSLRAILNLTPDEAAPSATEVSTTDSVATSNAQDATSTSGSLNGTDPATSSAGATPGV